MKMQIIAIVVAAVGGGGVGALLVGSGGEAQAPADLERVEELNARLDTLERQNQELLDRVTTLEYQPPMEASPARAVVPETATPGSEEIAELIESLSKPDQPLPANFRQEIGNVVQEIRDQEEQAREAEREKERAKRFEEGLARLAEQLGLTPYQTEEMRKTLTDAEAKFRAMRDGMREGGGFGNMRDQMNAIREETKTSLSRFLTQEQITKYEESERGFFRGRGGAGGGRGGTGGGPGGGRGNRGE